MNVLHIGLVRSKRMFVPFNDVWESHATGILKTSVQEASSSKEA